MRSKFQKRIQNSAEPFEGSECYPIAEPSLAEPFFKFRSAKKVPSEKYRTFRVYSEAIRVQLKTIWVLYFSDRIFSCSAELKKRFCKRGFYYRVKFRTFKGFCRTFYPFFETLDAFGCFYFSAEPFWRIRSTTFFIFRVELLSRGKQLTP